MKERLHFLDGHGNKVSAILSTPNTGNLPAVILCHGLDTGKDSITNLALEKILLKNKIATLRFDFFAHGESEGRVEDRRFERFVDDIINAIGFLKRRGYKNIGIVGTSLGGAAAVIAASESHDLKVMALKAPGMGKTSRELSNYKKSFYNKAWIEAGKKVRMPTLVVHGTADEDVEVELGKELAKSIKNSQMDLFEGTDHGFTRKEDFERMIEHISGFIIKNILRA